MADDISIWLTISELAEEKGISRAAASERVLRLEQQALITTRPGKGKTKLVNIAEFDRVVGQVTDLAREQGQATRRGDGEDGEGGTASAAYTAQQAKRAGYLAEIARLILRNGSAILSARPSCARWSRPPRRRSLPQSTASLTRPMPCAR